MSTILPFGSNALTTYLYEPFSYTISNPPPGTYTLTTSNTPGIPPGYLVNNGSNVVFATPSNGMNTGTEVFTVTASLGGTVVGTSSNSVTINSGRFVDASGNGYVGSNYTFYKNEPITPIRLVAPFAVSQPTSVPSLPPGLTYSNVSPTTYDIRGTPLVTVPQSNYLIIGKASGSNLGKIVTSQFAISISNERVLLNLSGSPIVSPMTVGTAIDPRVLTALFPPYPSGGTLRYSWPGLPDGIVVTDSSGIVQTSTTFTPTDASSTLILSGTPTITAANAFRDAGISSVTVPFTATRTNPLPQISNARDITFRFGETVLFDTPSVPTFYSGVALDPSATFFRAETYFNAGAPITNIFSPDLRADFSLNFVPAQGRAYLFSPTPPGAPGATGTASFTIRAINSNAVFRDLSVPITVAADVVTFSLPPPTPVDVCYNFVLSRPASLPLDGYYPSNIRFQATAASGKPIVFSSTNLTGTGLVLSNVSSNTVQIAGIPDTVTPLSTVTVTASAVGTPATASRTFKLAVLNDTIALSDVSGLSFVQNRVITPIQFSASTLSTRPVTSFTSTNLPSGMFLSTTGLLTGTPNDAADPSGSFIISASTGYASQNRAYTYRTIADNILILIPTTTVTVPETFSNVVFDVATYSGTTGNLISYFGPSGLVPYQSPSATLSVSGSNVLSGDFSGVPSLAKQYRFQVSGEAGSLIGGKQVNIDVGNVSNWHIALTAETITYPSPLPPYTPASPKITGRICVATEEPVTFASVFGYTPVASGPNFVTGPGPGLSNSPITYTFSVEGNGFDMARSSNVVVAVLGSNVIRSTDYGVTWRTARVTMPNGVFGPQWSGYSNVLVAGPPRERFYSPLFGSVATDGSSNWYAVGCGSKDLFDGNIWEPISIISTSTDNGLSWETIEIPPISSIDGLYDKLIYNQGRLFATHMDAAPVEVVLSRPINAAETIEIDRWEALESGLISVGGLAASNSTLFAVGLYDATKAATAVSTDNGDNWEAGADIATTSLDNTQYLDIVYRNNKWIASGNNGGFGLFRWSSNLTDWNDLLPASPPAGSYTAIADNGLSVVTSYSGGSGSDWEASLFDASAGLLSSSHLVVSPTVLGYTKRLLPMRVATGDPTLTLSIPYDALGINFTSPVQSQFTNWQFVPISPIQLLAANPVPGSFMYYYAVGLPRGLSLVLDASGIEASITGTSSQYSDSYQPAVLYAALNPGGGGGGVAAKQISFRTILPTVEKKQNDAGSWTSLVRQYTIVNAAQNSVNGRTLPSTEPPLGEFTRPHPPDSVSAPGDPNCVKRC